MQWDGKLIDRKVKIMDNDVYMDYGVDDQWQIKLSYISDNIFNYTYINSYESEDRKMIL